MLWKGEALDQLSYGCADIRFSDHRPVFATFRCTVSVVNDVIKSKLSRELYIKYESVITSKHPNSILDADDEEELLDMEPLAPGCMRPLPVPNQQLIATSGRPQLRKAKVVARGRSPRKIHHTGTFQQHPQPPAPAKPLR